MSITSAASCHFNLRLAEGKLDYQRNFYDVLFFDVDFFAESQMLMWDKKDQYGTRGEKCDQTKIKYAQEQHLICAEKNTDASDCNNTANYAKYFH